MIRACKLCKFWQAKETDPGSGECRHSTPCKGSDQDQRHWPVTREDDWCGDYRFRIVLEQEIPHQCRYCEFWEAEPPYEDGECRRRGPDMHIDQFQTFHPATCAKDWCGAFLQREGKLAVGTDKCPV